MNVQGNPGSHVWKIAGPPSMPGVETPPHPPPVVPMEFYMIKREPLRDEGISFPFVNPMRFQVYVTAACFTLTNILLL